uniref:CPBP family glutamic-type intramembrane protease n=1 Tax=Parerythrobacter lutipelagi TaxID=1964208 RepID=UPI0010F509ED|nr:CPBP family glutamic-type intramembrane protease [Parerythrobacter lutipelagi]
MTGTITTPDTPGTETREFAGSTRGEWRSYLAFLRSPALPANVTGISQFSLVATLQMLVLDLLIIGGLIICAMTAAALLGFEPPANALDELEWTPLIIIAVVLVAPIIEEIAFRGWLSGRPAAVLSLVVLGAGVAGLVLAGEANPLAGSGLFFVSLLGAVLVAVLLRKQLPWGWFSRAFPLFFWISTLAFALVHLSNYTEGSLATLLPFVIPQFISGSIFGYARVRYGLWSSILLHIAHNGALVAVIVTAIKFAV